MARSRWVVVRPGAAATAATITQTAASLRAAVSTTTARIAATTLVGAAFGGIETVAVDLAVAQPMRIHAGLQDGLNLAQAREAGMYGTMFGAGLGGAGSSAKAINDADGIYSALNHIRLGPVTRPSPAFPGGFPPGAMPGSGLDSGLNVAWRDIPEEVRKRFLAGNRFNTDNHPRYTHNEVHLKSGKQVDSYVRGKEIASRKYTQLSEIQTKSAKDYLNELADKYKPGEVIRSGKYPEIYGEKLRGAMILEVPARKNPIPQEVIEHAQGLRITIRDVSGKMYTCGRTCEHYLL
ncbi:hypothetical protein V1L54_14070 [Streptomyces sp. TRM 70361]|uniref:hypothetical protein n=1 Tax=Streptomyces sp. TRM 70361 TaxID=3116553 RepID=UPI002E7C520A|nr:hypothetical protein [Streptomyces sp. TRM 70361]MEE1940518.1 hypothetical protein [Streptomyces sp. TRM 70361]